MELQHKNLQPIISSCDGQNLTYRAPYFEWTRLWTLNEPALPFLLLLLLLHYLPVFVGRGT